MKTKDKVHIAIMIIILIAILCSCNNHKGFDSTENKVDTLIVQDVFIYNGEYALHTGVFIQPWEGASTNDFFYGFDPYVYNTYINGSFKYIKDIKKKEYNKAKAVYDSIRKVRKDSYKSRLTTFNRIQEMKDSIKLLNLKHTP